MIIYRRRWLPSGPFEGEDFLPTFLAAASDSDITTSLVVHLKRTWLIEVSIGWAWCAAGRRWRPADEESASGRRNSEKSFRQDSWGPNPIYQR
jgi:hypothetical protein